MSANIGTNDSGQHQSDSGGQPHRHLSQTYIEHLGWEACMAKYDREHTLFYCDPSYWGIEGYGVDFGIEQYTQMDDLARTIKGKMVISVNDIQEMRKAFAGLQMESLQITYTVDTLFEGKHFFCNFCIVQLYAGIA